MMARRPLFAVRTAVAVVLASVVLGGVMPNEASAFGTSSNSAALGEIAIVGGVVVGSAYLVVETALVVKSIRAGADGHGVSPGWAVFELVWGTAHVAPGVAFLAAAAVSDGADNVAIPLGVGIPMLTLGLWHIAHGIWSLAKGTPGREEVQREVAEGVQVDFDVSGIPAGASLRVFGTF